MISRNINLAASTILITGVAGFIGARLAEYILKNCKGTSVVGIDNLNDYYDVNLKEDRLKILYNYNNFTFKRGDITNIDTLTSIFLSFTPNIVVNLAAHVGIRDSMRQPYLCADTNLHGFLNILELCKIYSVQHLVYASSGSVYGNNRCIPFRLTDNTDNPENFLTATKKCNEVMAYSYSSLYKIPSTGIRLFTVYGPWGRPDMAVSKFAASFRSGIEIELYGEGEIERDFVYIDDVVKGITEIMTRAPSTHRIYNLGSGHPVTNFKIAQMIFDEMVRQCLVDNCNFDELYRLAPKNSGEILETFSDNTISSTYVNYYPEVSLSKGIKEFIYWYKNYYK